MWDEQTHKVYWSISNVYLKPYFACKISICYEISQNWNDENKRWKVEKKKKNKNMVANYNGHIILTMPS